MDVGRNEKGNCVGAAVSSIICVTTFNAKGYDLYGRNLIESYSRNWPKSIPLLVYTEGFSVPNLYHNVISEPLHAWWLESFKARHAHRTVSDFRYDAVRFSHKVAAVTEATRRGADYIIWIDGDVVTNKQIPEPAIEEWLPKGNEYISWLWRNHKYPECGFYILNCNHNAHKSIIKDFASLYSEDKLFLLSEFHDSFALQHVIVQSGVKWKSLSGGFEHANHPFVNGPLGVYMDHLKGSRKTEGASRQSDFVRRK